MKSRGLGAGTALALPLFALPSPSLTHEVLLALFSHFGEATRKVVAREISLPASPMFVRSASADLSQLVPTQHLADHVLAFYERPPANEYEEKHAALVIILESQLSIDEGKHFAWPSYVANAAKRFHCEAVLLALTADPAVAEWARGPFGSSRMPLRPVVFCLAEMPQQLSIDEALENPLLAVLHALSYPNPSTAEIALDVIKQLPDELRELSFTMIMNTQRIEYRGVVSVERLRELTLQVPLVKEVMEEAIEERVAEARKEAFNEAFNEARKEAFNEARKEAFDEARKEVFNEVRKEVFNEVRKEVFNEARKEAFNEARKEAFNEARAQQLAVIQGLAFDLLRSKLLQLQAAEEEQLRKADEATLTALIMDLGIAVEEAQLRAAVARSLARVA